MSLRAVLLAVLLAWASAACAAPGGDVQGDDAATPVAPAEAPPPASSQALETAGGAWVIDWWLEPQELTAAELFDHGLFDLRARVRRPDGRPAPDDVELRVDAGMPQHRHGMNVEPELRRSGPGEFEAAGLLFHMPGAWTLTFDVVDGALAERAQTVLEVD